MLLESLLSAAIQTSIGLLAKVGLGDEIRDLKDQLPNAPERRRREALDRALTRATEAVGGNAVAPLLEASSLSRRGSQAAPRPDKWLRRRGGRKCVERLPPAAWPRSAPLPYHTGRVFADETWGPILDRYQQCRFQHEVKEKLQARNLGL